MGGGAGGDTSGQQVGGFCLFDSLKRSGASVCVRLLTATLQVFVSSFLLSRLSSLCL